MAFQYAFNDPRSLLEQRGYQMRDGRLFLPGYTQDYFKTAYDPDTGSGGQVELPWANPTRDITGVNPVAADGEDPSIYGNPYYKLAIGRTGSGHAGNDEYDWNAVWTDPSQQPEFVDGGLLLPASTRVGPHNVPYNHESTWQSIAPMAQFALSAVDGYMGLSALGGFLAAPSLAGAPAALGGANALASMSTGGALSLPGEVSRPLSIYNMGSSAINSDWTNGGYTGRGMGFAEGLPSTFSGDDDMSFFPDYLGDVGDGFDGGGSPDEFGLDADYGGLGPQGYQVAGETGTFFGGGNYGYDTSADEFGLLPEYGNVGPQGLQVPGAGNVFGSPLSIVKAVSQGLLPAAALSQLLANGSVIRDAAGRLIDRASGAILNAATGGGSSLLEKGLASAPIIAAMEYARNQAPFDTTRFENISGSVPSSFATDTSRLTGIFNQLDPNAAASAFDANTASGREQLMTDLARRGVSGSSFGNADIATFDSTRDVGRRTLINQALGTQAGVAENIAGLEANDQNRGLTADTLRANIADKILQAQIASQKNKNDLYGRSLLALGNVFGGRNAYA